MSQEKIKKFFIESKYSKDWVDWLKQKHIYDIQLPITAKLSGNAAGEYVLDIGTGTGRFAFLYTKLKAKLVIGLDVSKQILEIARSNISDENNISFIVADAEHLPIRGEFFDIVNCQEVLVHLPNPNLAAKEMIRVTRKGGIIIVNATTRPCKILLDLWKKATIAKGAQVFNKGILIQNKKAGGELYIRYFLPSELKEMFEYEGSTLNQVAIGCFTGIHGLMTAIISTFMSIFPRDKYPFNLMGMFTTIKVQKCK